MSGQEESGQTAHDTGLLILRLLDEHKCQPSVCLSSLLTVVSVIAQQMGLPKAVFLSIAAKTYECMRPKAKESA